MHGGSVAGFYRVFHVKHLVIQCVCGVSAGDLSHIAGVCVYDNSLVGSWIFHDLNIALFAADHRALGLFGVHGEGDSRHLAGAVF